MPHLKYNGRFWRVSSDELFLPGIFAILGRLFWSTVIIIILAFSTARLSRCSESKGLLAYLYISLIVFVMSFLCEVCLVRKSLLGSMVETEKRDKGLEKFLTAHIVLCVSQLVLAIFGVFVVSADSFVPCASAFQMSKTYDLILLSVIIITQFVDVSSLLCCCYTFSAKKGSAEFPDHDDVITSIWENRCKSVMKCLQIISCNIFGGSHIERDLQAVAKILTTFFHHDGFLDVVPSDILAGIILVRIQQRAKRFQLSSRELLITQRSSSEIDIERGGYTAAAISSPDVIPDSANETMEDYDEENQSDRPLARMSVHAVAYRRDLDKSSKSDRNILESVAKYSVHMLAMYTHLMVLFTQPCTGLYCLCRSRVKISCARCKRNQCRKCCDNSCCGRDIPSKHTPEVKGDNMWGTHHAGLSHFTRNVKSEVLYVSYRNDTARKPFAVFLDEEDCSVVIAIRGSLSIEDCITDAIADPKELLEAGLKWGFDGKDRFVHTGFLTAALSIREELEETGILDHIFQQSKATDPKVREPTLRSQSGVFVGSRDCENELQVSAAE
jgi:sn1-specific diacylglycerol lipase